MTTRAAVIGSPIGHSLSPAIFRAAFAATGLDWTYDALEVDEVGAAAFMDEVRAGRLEGLSVTMPNKAAVIDGLDGLDGVAKDLHAVNCVAREGGRAVGHNTDGDGLLDALRLDEGIEVTGLRCAVIGAGGAGRAVARAFGAAGAAQVMIVNRSPQPATRAAALAGAAGIVGAPADLAGADLIVNTTPLGMGDDERLPLDPSLLAAGQTVVDIVYHPAETPLLRAAVAAGARPVGGLGMLVHQAAHAFRFWTGKDAPVDAMRAGVLEALAARGAG